MPESNVPLSEVIGRNLARWRQDYGWTQDHAASVLRLHGLPWTRTMLAKVERGERSVTLEELLVLSIALGPRPWQFIEDRPDRWVSLSDDVAITTRALSFLLRGEEAGAHNVRLSFTEPPTPDPAWPELNPADLKLAEAEASGEAEAKAAARLGADPLTVARAARAAWGCSLPTQRDARVTEAAPAGASPRTVQAVRGHVTRELLKELRPVVEGRKRARGKR